MRLPSLSSYLPSSRSHLWLVGFGALLTLIVGTSVMKAQMKSPASKRAAHLQQASSRFKKQPTKKLTKKLTRKAQKPAPRVRYIRVGLSTQGGPIALWSEFAMTITDAVQPGRRLTIKPREIVTFSYGKNAQVFQLKTVPKSGVNTRGQRWQGPLQIKTSSGISPAWQVARIWTSGSATRISTNGTNPRWHRAYRGGFEIASQTFSFEPAKHQGRLRLVNVVPLDDYLKGVVPWEMNPSAPLEALKAQAICARSITLSKIALDRHVADGYDICDYDHCQGYSGTDNEHPRSTLAVQQTAGLAIFYQDRVADAVYTTNSGGITAAASDVWRGRPQPHLQSVRDFLRTRHHSTSQLVKAKMSEADWALYCSQNLPSYAQPASLQYRTLAARRRRSTFAASLFQPSDLPEFYRWTRVVTPRQLAQALSRSVKMDNIREIQVLERAASGRIKRLLIRGEVIKDGKPVASPPVILDGDGKIRGMLSGRLGSTTALPSSMFVVLPQRDSQGRLTAFIFKGAGWGHGVGMCQRGAQNHAREGWNARQIINFYFHDVEVRKIQ